MKEDQIKWRHHCLANIEFVHIYHVFLDINKRRYEKSSIFSFCIFDQHKIRHCKGYQ